MMAGAATESLRLAAASGSFGPTAQFAGAGCPAHRPAGPQKISRKGESTVKAFFLMFE